MSKHIGCNIINIESTSSFEIMVDCVNDGKLRSQKLVAISERLLASAKNLSTDLTPTTALDQAKYCKVGLERAHTA